MLRADGILRRSDAAALKCRAELKGDRYIVNGVKTFITSGNIARYCVLAATTDPARGYKAIINLIVDLKNTPGFKVGKVEEKMGILASGTAELIFEEAEVPAENLLGKPGAGFQADALRPRRREDRNRRPGLRDRPGGPRGRRRILRERIQFGKPIATFQAIQFKLADMATELDAAELMLLRAAWLGGQRPRFRERGGDGQVLRLRRGNEGGDRGGSRSSAATAT